MHIQLRIQSIYFLFLISLYYDDKISNFDDVFSGMMIGGDIYKNRNGHLPQADGRVWYEADINYTNGYRNRHRILFSNDGLIFVTYDHYETFWEVI